MKTIILNRSTAAKIWNGRIDEAAVEEVLAAFEANELGEQQGAVAIVLDDGVAAHWAEVLRLRPVSVESDLARELNDAFVLALGIIPEADNRWALIQQ